MRLRRLRESSIDLEKTYHSQRPEDAIVDHEPGLLAEPGDRLLLGDALRPREGRQNVIHSGGAQKSKEDNAEEYGIAIVNAYTILPSVRIVVGEVEVLVGVFADAP